MKYWKSIITHILIFMLCTSSASAHFHPNLDAQPLVSDWASVEIARAESLGIVHLRDNINSDFRQPISRGDFVSIAMNFVAIQQHCDSQSLCQLSIFYLGNKNADGNVEFPFSDGGEQEAAAYFLGVIKGRGTGVFEPEALITRQEAAVMLTQAYISCGGVLPDITEEIEYEDREMIAPWAAQSVASLASWNIMSGIGDNIFSPNDSYSVEQCIVTFLRLYENAPVSQKNRNVIPRFSYEQCVGFIESKPSLLPIIKEEGALATYIRVDSPGVMIWPSSLYFVYRTGGIHKLDLGICKYPASGGFITTDVEVKETSFSKDGRTFYCTAVLSDDTIDSTSGEILHQKGEYHIIIDVETCQHQ